ncbi:hypothetical protein SpCBS45565_g08075 [Spizellomyces sp. 'palustris']|nr:hypothetical protein SpCBS45565_g08075 [Spizellomyces sp. 'palustris']
MEAVAEVSLVNPFGANISIEHAHTSFAPLVHANSFTCSAPHSTTILQSQAASGSTWTRRSLQEVVVQLPTSSKNVLDDADLELGGELSVADIDAILDTDPRGHNARKESRHLGKLDCESLSHCQRPATNIPQHHGPESFCMSDSTDDRMQMSDEPAAAEGVVPSPSCEKTEELTEPKHSVQNEEVSPEPINLIPLAASGRTPPRPRRSMSIENLVAERLSQSHNTTASPALPSGPDQQDGVRCQSEYQDPSTNFSPARARDRLAVERVLKKAPYQKYLHQIEVRLKYTMFKVQNGWENKSLAEVTKDYVDTCSVTPESRNSVAIGQSCKRLLPDFEHNCDTRSAKKKVAAFRETRQNRTNVGLTGKRPNDADVTNAALVLQSLSRAGTPPDVPKRAPSHCASRAVKRKHAKERKSTHTNPPAAQLAISGMASQYLSTGRQQIQQQTDLVQRTVPWFTTESQSKTLPTPATFYVPPLPYAYTIPSTSRPSSVNSNFPQPLPIGRESSRSPPTNDQKQNSTVAAWYALARANQSADVSGRLGKYIGSPRRRGKYTSPTQKLP